MQNNNVYIYWIGKEYKLITILRKLMYIHSNNGKGYNIHLINHTNINKYIKNIPECFKNLKPANQADFVRVHVICEYGGIWLDSDTLVLDSLDSLFDILDKKDGFLIKENNEILCNGVFGSKKNTIFMETWKNNMMTKLNTTNGEISWTGIGSKMMEAIYKLNPHMLSNYTIFKGLDNIYPINYDKCVKQFITKPYDNYKNIIRDYQPLIILVNSVYKSLEDKTEDEILNTPTPLSYFINKSYSNIKKNIVIYPSPSKELNVNEKMFCHPVIRDKFDLIEDINVETLDKLYNDKNKSINSITILLDNYGKFIKNNIEFIIFHKEIKFYIHENDIHYLPSKPNTYSRYALLRDKLVDNQHIYILSYYWYHYSNLYKINKNNLICFPKFVFQKNILPFNINPQKKVLLSGCMNKYYPMRNYLKSLKHPDIDILIHSDNIFGDDYYIHLNKYICAFSCCATKYTPYIVNKFFEIPAAGCLLLAYDEYVKYGLKEIGFIDGENYISCNKENIIDKINYICNNSNINEVNRIRKNGQELIKNRHTLEHRYDLLVNII